MAAMFRASLAETRRSISAWITLGQAISESQITPSIGEISGRRPRKAATRPIAGVRARNKHKLALFRRAGNIGSNKKRKEPMIRLGRIFSALALLLADGDRPSSINFGTSTGGRYGTAGWQGRGYHRRNKRDRAAHRRDFRRGRREDRYRRTTRAGRRGAGQEARRQLHLPPDRC